MAGTMDVVKLAILRRGTVIPAHPLALTPGRALDERRQRALTRYYLAAGVGGLAVGVHTTQFAIRRPKVGLLRPVLELAAETVTCLADDPVVMIAGVCGDVDQAVREAALAQELGYDAVLVMPTGGQSHEAGLLDKARAVGEVLPIVGFYLQEPVGGFPLSYDFWRRFLEIEAVVAVKVAPFDRYRTVDVLRAVHDSGRASDIPVYTGNDDNIIGDLLVSYDGVRCVGGLLGQWAVWTRAAVRLLEQVKAALAGDEFEMAILLQQAHELTDVNAAVFDAAGGFAGCICGVHEVLRRQGLLEGTWTLERDERLSPGQSAEIDRVIGSYRWLDDDDNFVAEHLDEWMSA